MINHYCLICLFLLIFPMSAFSASSVEIVAKQRLIIAQTRGIVTLPFNVTNNSNKTQQFNENISLPEGWRLLANSGSFTLTKGQTTLRLVHVLAPSDIPAGKYKMPYEVVANNDSSIRATEEISVVIKSLSKLKVDILEKPDLVIAGEEYSTTVSVTNNGNTPLSLSADLSNTSPYPATFEPKQLTLKPSEQSIISVSSKVPKTLKKPITHALKLTLSGKSIFVEKSLNTQIITVKPKGVGYYHPLPSTITSIFSKSKRESVLQTEISASGLLDQNGKHHINFVYRDTSTNQISSLGSNAEKRIAYDHSDVSVRLGDYSYLFAGITAESFYGEGFDIDYHPAGKKWNLRALQAKQRESEENNADISGFEVGYKISDNTHVALNRLTLDYKNKDLDKDTLTGIDISWDKYEQAEINLSLAKGDEGKAFRLSQEGNLGLINYGFEIRNADTDFGGRINDIKSENFVSSFSFNNNKNYLRATAYHSRNNLINDENRRITEQKSIRFGVGHFFSNPLRDSLLAEVFVRRNKDLRNVSDMDETETGFSLQYQKSVNKNLRLNTILQHVKTEDKHTKKQSEDLRGSLTLAYAPNKKYRFGANIDTINNSDNFGTYIKNSIKYGFNASVDINPRQRLTGFYGGDNNNNNSLQLNYDYTFFNGISVGASISQDSSVFNDDLSYLLKVSVPFDTPLYRYKNISSLKGQVYNKALQQPVSNAIVEVAGQYSVTDNSGNYQFYSVREGEYNVTTNLTKTDLNNYIVENNQQQKITLKANKPSIHNINLFQGTGIKGQVLAYQLSSGSISSNINSDNLKATSGIQNLLVTIISQNNTDESYKMLTSDGGYFNFNGVKSGAWSIQVTDPSNILQDSRITEPQRLVNLFEGEEKSVLFKSVPLSRQIRKVGPSSGFSVSGE